MDLEDLKAMASAVAILGFIFVVIIVLSGVVGLATVIFRAITGV